MSDLPLERIEVVRGAAASLYGNDAVGGVVQLVSRMLTKKQVDRAFLGFVKMVEASTEGSEEVPREEPKRKWRQDLLDTVKAVL